MFPKQLNAQLNITLSDVAMSPQLRSAVIIPTTAASSTDNIASLSFSANYRFNVDDNAE